MFKTIMLETTKIQQMWGCFEMNQSKSRKMGQKFSDPQWKYVVKQSLFFRFLQWNFMKYVQ